MKQRMSTHLKMFFFFTLLCGCQQSPDESSVETQSTSGRSANEPVGEVEGTDRVAATPVDSKRESEVESKIRFDLASDIGLDFNHIAGRSAEKYMPETMGGGVALADFNNDGAVDVLFVNSGSFVDAQTIKPAPHKLCINNGKGKFNDETMKWGLKNLGYGMGVAVGDFNNDGWPDVFLTTFDGKDQLLKNVEGTSFEDVTAAAGVRSDGWSTSAGFLDMDGDGDLDLYVVKYVLYDPTDALPCYVKGFLTYCTPVMFDPVPDRLYRNNGDGTFSEVSAEAGIPTTGKGLALTIGDIDRDGDSDIYVANDTTSNFLLINNGKGRFEDQASLLGVGHSNFGQEEAGMGADFSDVDGNGKLDIVCTNFQNEATSMYMQQEQGFFMERSDSIGVGETARQRLSFGVDFFDADNDGDEDLLVANGHVDIDVGKYQTGVGFGQRNTLYENRDGKFVDITEQAGDAFSLAQPSRGLATGDLDNDGDLDFVVVNTHGNAEVGINRSTEVGNYIRLRIPDAHFASVVSAQLNGNHRSWSPIVSSSYLSSHGNLIHIGLGTQEKLDEITVSWVNDVLSITLKDLRSNSVYEFKQTE